MVLKAQCHIGCIQRKRFFTSLDGPIYFKQAKCFASVPTLELHKIHNSIVLDKFSRLIDVLVFSAVRTNQTSVFADNGRKNTSSSVEKHEHTDQMTCDSTLTEAVPKNVTEQAPIDPKDITIRPAPVFRCPGRGRWTNQLKYLLNTVIKPILNLKCSRYFKAPVDPITLRVPVSDAFKFCKTQKFIAEAIIVVVSDVHFYFFGVLCLIKRNFLSEKKSFKFLSFQN